MNQHQDEHLRHLEANREKLNQFSNHVTGKVVSTIGGIAVSRMRPFRSGGTHMELFLRHNFGVGYFPPLFWITTIIGLGAGIYFSSVTLFGSPNADPHSVLTAFSFLIASILFLVPVAAHGISILLRFAETSGLHSQHPGDSWLDDLNEWMKTKEAPSFRYAKRTLAWMCADSLRRDFLGETVAGILIAYAVGWICFNGYVTDYLLFSLALTQLKRVARIRQSISEKRKWNDAQRDMERRG
jgi:hypothetical protein